MKNVKNENVCSSDNNVNKKSVSRLHEEYSIADLIKCISIIAFSRDVIYFHSHMQLGRSEIEKPDRTYVFDLTIVDVTLYKCNTHL